MCNSSPEGFLPEVTDPEEEEEESGLKKTSRGEFGEDGHCEIFFRISGYGSGSSEKLNVMIV